MNGKHDHSVAVQGKFLAEGVKNRAARWTAPLTLRQLAVAVFELFARSAGAEVIAARVTPS